MLPTSPSPSAPSSSSDRNEPGGTTTTTTPAAPSESSADDAHPHGRKADFFRADPCSFFDPHAFDDLGDTVTVTPSTSNYERCELTVAAATGKESASWSVRVNMGATFPDPASLQQIMPGRYTTGTFHGTPIIIGISGRTCVRAFQLPTDVEATAVVVTKGDSLPCKPIELALGTVMEHVANRSMSVLKPAGPALASTDLCAAEDRLARQLMGNSARRQGFGLHGCQWITPDRTVSLHVDATTWPPLGFGSSSTKLTVAGHHAVAVHNRTGGTSISMVAVDLGAATVGVEGSRTVVEAIMSGSDGRAEQESHLMRFTAAVIAA